MALERKRGIERCQALEQRTRACHRQVDRIAPEALVERIAEEQHTILGLPDDDRVVGVVAADPTQLDCRVAEVDLM